MSCHCLNLECCGATKDECWSALSPSKNCCWNSGSNLRDQLQVPQRLIRALLDGRMLGTLGVPFILGMTFYWHLQKNLSCLPTSHGWYLRVCDKLKFKDFHENLWSGFLEPEFTLRNAEKLSCSCHVPLPALINLDICSVVCLDIFHSLFFLFLVTLPFAWNSFSLILGRVPLNDPGACSTCLSVSQQWFDKPPICCYLQQEVMLIYHKIYAYAIQLKASHEHEWLERAV